MSTVQLCLLPCSMSFIHYGLTAVLTRVCAVKCNIIPVLRRQRYWILSSATSPWSDRLGPTAASRSAAFYATTGLAASAAVSRSAFYAANGLAATATVSSSAFYAANGLAATAAVSSSAFYAANGLAAAAGAQCELPSWLPTSCLAATKPVSTSAKSFRYFF
jgi:hypothetical protein